MPLERKYDYVLIEKMYKEGAKYEEIAAAIGGNKGAVSGAIRQMRIKANRLKEKSKTPMAKERYPNAVCPYCGNKDYWYTHQTKSRPEQCAQCTECRKVYDLELDYSKLPDMTIVWCKANGVHNKLNVTSRFLKIQKLSSHLLKFEFGKIIFNESIGESPYKHPKFGFRINSVKLCREIIHHVFGDTPPPERTLYFRLNHLQGNEYALQVIEPDPNSKKYNQ